MKSRRSKVKIHPSQVSTTPKQTYFLTNIATLGRQRSTRRHALEAHHHILQVRRQHPLLRRNRLIRNRQNHLLYRLPTLLPLLEHKIQRSSPLLLPRLPSHKQLPTHLRPRLPNSSFHRHSTSLDISIIRVPSRRHRSIMVWSYLTTSSFSPGDEALGGR